MTSPKVMADVRMGRTVTGFWTDLPTARAVILRGFDAEAITLSLDPLPPNAPAIAVYYPHAEPVMSKVVDAMLHELEHAAIELFPAWLPAALAVSGETDLAIAAIRLIAKEVASTSDHFGPFLSDLAECAMRRRANGLSRYATETRAIGLARILKASYDRPLAAILVSVPDGFPADCEQPLLAAAEWIAQHANVGVWLAGMLRSPERLMSVTVHLPGYLASPATRGMPSMLQVPAGPVFLYPPIAGKPHPGSPAEQKLEAALLNKVWAEGRVWNQSYCSHPLVNPVRLDLWWRDERCVVEVDGPEHRGKWKFAEDHRRDVMLLGDGFAVLRFTNAQVLDELDVVLAAIEQFLQTRRKSQGELARHG